VSPIAIGAGLLGAGLVGFWRYKSVKVGDVVSVHVASPAGLDVTTEMMVTGADADGSGYTVTPAANALGPVIASMHVTKAQVLANLSPRLW
jgi:hypothetical protein